MKNVKIINNMFGDVLWALVYFIEYREKEKIITINGSLLEKILRQLDLIEICEIQNSLLAKVFSIKFLPKFIYNKYHKYNLKKKSNVADICYPIPKKNDFKKFIDSLKNENLKHNWHIEYLKIENRFLSFGLNPLDLSKSHLANQIIKKHDKININLDRYKPYVVINIKPKTLKQKLGINGSERNISQLEDLTLSIDFLIKIGYSIFIFNDNKIINKDKKEEIFDMKSNLINSSFIIKQSSFVISSRSGFTLIPALMGIDVIELNMIDLSSNIAKNTYGLIRKNSKEKLNKDEIIKIFNSEWFYSSDTHKKKLLCNKYINNSRDILNAVKIYTNKEKEKIINTSEITNISHLFAHTIPYNIFLV